MKTFIKGLIYLSLVASILCFIGAYFLYQNIEMFDKEDLVRVDATFDNYRYDEGYYIYIESELKPYYVPSFIDGIDGEKVRLLEKGDEITLWIIERDTSNHQGNLLELRSSNIVILSIDDYNRDNKANTVLGVITTSIFGILFLGIFIYQIRRIDLPYDDTFDLEEFMNQEVEIKDGFLHVNYERYEGDSFEETWFEKLKDNDIRFFYDDSSYRNLESILLFKRGKRLMTMHMEHLDGYYQMDLAWLAYHYPKYRRMSKEDIRIFLENLEAYIEETGINIKINHQ